MKGVIYCRVSSKEQVQGTSLESQEIACREYATQHQIEIVRVFVERGESAKFADRTQLLELMEFGRNPQNAIECVLVWKVDRLARNVGDHFNIKAVLLKQGARVMSVTEPIGADPEGKLLETILAGFAQFDNDLRAARTVQGMRRKIQEGLFPWKPPLGYGIAVQPGSKKTVADEPDKPVFGQLQKAWEEYATGAYTKAEIIRLLKARGVRTKHGRPITKQSLDNMLRDRYYAGIIRDPWSETEHMGRHLPMVSQEVYAKIQAVIETRQRTVRHERVRPEFPLRSFARCSHCEHYLTGSHSRGRSKYYSYYHCFNGSCSMRDNQGTEALHDEFTAFLASITPDRRGIQEIADAVAGATKKRIEHDDQMRGKFHLEKRRLDQQQERLIQMRMDSLLTNDEFLQQKALLTSRINDLKNRMPVDADEEDDLVNKLDIICKPLTQLPATWEATEPQLKLRFQRLILPAGFVSGRIGTAQMGCLFSTFQRSGDYKSRLVPPTGQFWNQFTDDVRELATLVS